MYRIDDATAATSLPVPEVASTEGYFTEGNPSGGTPATNVRGSWLNMIQEELCSLLAAAGITHSKTTYNQVNKALQQMYSSVVGSVRNGKMTIAAGATSATYTADEVVVESALGGQTYRLANVNLTGSLGTVGINGMDTGTATANSFLAQYVMFNPTTGASGLIWSLEGAAVAPSVYGGANAPAGYTASTLVSVVPTGGTVGQFAAVSVQDRKHTIAEFTFINSNTTSGTPGNSALTSTGIPKSAIRMSGSISISNSGIMNSIWKFFADANSTGSKQFSVNSTTGGGGNLFGYTSVPLSAPQTLRATAFVAGGSGTMSYILLSSEYEI